MPEVPSTTQSLWIPRPGFFVGRVAYRVLRTLGSPETIEAAVNEVLPEGKTLSSKLALLTYVGYRENAGHKLISESSVRDFERNWRADVRTASTKELVAETDLLRVLSVTKNDATADEPALNIPDLPELTLAILKASQTEITSFAAGSRAVHRTPQLRGRF